MVAYLEYNGPHITYIFIRSENISRVWETKVFQVWFVFRRKLSVFDFRYNDVVLSQHFLRGIYHKTYIPYKDHSESNLSLGGRKHPNCKWRNLRIKTFVRELNCARSLACNKSILFGSWWFKWRKRTDASD